MDEVSSELPKSLGNDIDPTTGNFKVDSRQPEHLTEQEWAEKNVLRAIADMEEPLQVILNKIRPDIEKGNFPLIIGDDCSGRVPALAVYNVIKDLNKKSGIKEPIITFFAGARTIGYKTEAVKGIGDHLIEELPKDVTVARLRKKTADIRAALREHYSDVLPQQNLANKLHGRNKKVLIVTERITSGLGPRPLLAALRAEKVPFELATLTTTSRWYELESLIRLGKMPTKGEVRQLNNIFFGTGRADYKALGLTKDPQDLYAHIDPDFKYLIPIEREALSELSRRLIEDFKEK